MMLRFPSLSHCKFIVFTLLILLGATAAAQDIGYRAVPQQQPYVPQYGPYADTETTDALSLSGTWRMQVEDEEWREVPVPGSWPGGQGEVVLRRMFEIPPTWIGSHIRLVFWKVRPNVAVSLNGTLIAASEGDWPQLIIDVPPEMVNFDGPNELMVELNDHLSARASIPLKPKLFDSISWSGILGDVILYSGPTISLASLGWDTQIDSGATSADWTLSVSIRNYAAANRDTLTERSVTVSLEYAAPSDTVFRELRETHTVVVDPLQNERVEFSGTMRNVQLWTPDRPNLYTMAIVFQEGEREWKVPFKLGFRSAVWRDGNFYLNHKSFELRGIDVRQEIPEAGGAVPLSKIEDDLSRIRKQGFNLVRIIDATPHPATAEICDRLGLFLLPQIGLRGVPASLLQEESFITRMGTMLRFLVERGSHHASVIGWGIGDWLPPSSAVVDLGVSLRAATIPADGPPLILGFASTEAFDLPEGLVGLRERWPYAFEQRVAPQIEPHGTWMMAGLGALATPMVLDEDTLDSQIRQSESLIRQIRAVRELPVAGFIVDGYNDRQGALPLLIAGGQSAPKIIQRGLVTPDREGRIAWQKIGDVLGQLKTDVAILDVRGGEFPIAFPIVTLIVGGMLLLVMRQNNVFRQNLKRVFAHTHGFFSDIVGRRYFQSGQTLFIALIFSVSQGILLASLLNHSRFDFSLDYVITLLFPFPQVKDILVYWAWHPLQAIGGFSLLVFILLVLSAIIIRLISIPFPETLKLRHAFSLVTWASTCFLPLIPLGLVYHRLLDYAWFNTGQLILFVIFWYWYFVRIAGVIRVGYRVSHRTAWLLILIMLLIGAGSIWTFYRSGFAIVDYIEYYADVIRPWTTG